MIVLSVLLIASVVVNVAGYNYYQNKYKPKFSLLSPDIAWMETDDFLAIQNQYSVSYQGMKQEMLELLNSSKVHGNYGVYFEDLNTGSWIGINERDEFIPASLLKVPIMVAVLKKVEKGDIALDQRVTIVAEDINLNSGTLGTQGAGYVLTVKDLLTYLIKESDNTALFTLYRNFLTDNDVLEARLAMGISLYGDKAVLGPKHYSNILRSLYYSAYLRRTFSELALSIMSETDYDTQMKAGLPPNVHISHKIGFFKTPEGVEGYHDCGIIYHPRKPYMLCIMSKNTDQATAKFVISNLSKLVYDYVDKISK